MENQEQNTKPKRGRKMGSRNKQHKFKVLVKNLRSNEWEELDKTYPSFVEIAKDLNYSYNQVRNLAVGRSKILSNSLKVTRI